MKQNENLKVGGCVPRYRSYGNENVIQVEVVRSSWKLVNKDEVDFPEKGNVLT